MPSPLLDVVSVMFGALVPVDDGMWKSEVGTSDVIVVDDTIIEQHTNHDM